MRAFAGISSEPFSLRNLPTDRKSAIILWAGRAISVTSSKKKAEFGYFSSSPSFAETPSDRESFSYPKISPASE